MTSGYTATGPFSNGIAPGVSAAFLNNVEAFLGSLSSDATTINGTTSGTLVYSFPLWGSGTKVMVITLNNYAGTVQTVTLPTTFSRGLVFTVDLGGGTPNLQPRNGGGNVSVTAASGLASGANGTESTATHIWQANMVAIVSTIDSFQFTPGGTSNGTILMIGH